MNLYSVVQGGRQLDRPHPLLQSPCRILGDIDMSDEMNFTKPIRIDGDGLFSLSQNAIIDLIIAYKLHSKWWVQL